MFYRRAFLGFVAIAAAACSSGTTTPPPPPPVTVASVAVTPGSLNLVVGQNGALTATALSASGTPITGKTATWSSSAPVVATVSNEGLVTAVTPGSGTITATIDGKTGSANVTVVPPAVATVTVSPATLNLDVGASATLTATVRDASGAPIPGKSVSWLSSNPAVVTVNPAGTVTALAEGTTQITASVDGVSGSATITVHTLVGSVVVSPAAAALPVGGTVQLTAVPQSNTGTPLPDRPVTWSTSSPVIATVSATGLVTAQGIGSATISASSEGKTGTATITVSVVPVASVLVAPSSPTLLAGSSVQLTATARDSAGNPLSGRSITWTSGNAAIAIVSTVGLVTAVAPGQAVVTATSEGKSGSATITVVVPVASVVVAPASSTVLAGSSVQLSATARDSAGNPLAGRSITWTSGNPAIAIVSTAGLVTAVAPGQAVVTATSEGKSGSATITVVVAPVATVEVVPSAAELFLGEAFQFTAVVRNAAGDPLTGRTVTWTSKTPAVATVTSPGGRVTAVAIGTTTITASSEGKQGTASIRVVPVPPASMTIVPANSTIAAGEILVLVAMPRDAGGNPLPGRTAFWYEANGAVAHGYASHDTVVVTGITAGRDTVTAAIDGTSAEALVQVTSSPTDICSQIAGASVIANDGTYLGRLTNSGDAESVYNPYGTYGSPTGALSIYNRNGTYGNQYSVKSPWNPSTATPPTLTKNSSTLGSFTLNRLLSPRISPTYAEYCSFP